MTLSRPQHLAVLAAMVAVPSACTGTDTTSDTPTITDDLVANVVTIPPVPATTSPAAGGTTIAAPAGQAVGIDLIGEMPAADVRVGEPSIVRFAGVPLTDIAISPSGSWIASNRGTEICLIDTAVGTVTADEGCVAFGDGIADRSMSWSPDESTIAFHHDLFRTQAEPDIVVLDTAALEFEVVTEDASEDVEGGLVDIAPFHDDTGTLHFFRIDDGPAAQLMTLAGPEVTPVDGVRLTPFVARAVRDPSTGRIALIVPESAGTGSIRLLDPSARTVNPTAARDIVVPEISDVRGARALLVPLDTGQGGDQIAALVDLERSAPARLILRDIDDHRSVTGVGLSSDGSAVALIIEDRVDPAGHQLVVAPMLDDGSIGSFAVVATGPEFAPSDGDTTIRPHGLGDRNEIEWVDDRMIYGLGPDRIVTLAVAGPP